MMAPACVGGMVWGSEAEGGADCVGHVEFFPGEEFYFAGNGLLAESFECLGDGAGCASHVAVGGCLAVDGGAEFQALLDGVGSHVEELLYAARDLAVGHIDLGCAVGVDIEAYRLGDADGVGYLDEGTRCDAGGNEVLGDVAGSVGSRAVDLAGVFA